MICVCAQIRKDGHMEENAQKFLEKMNELVALGKKKKSILDVLGGSMTIFLRDHFRELSSPETKMRTKRFLKIGI